MLMSVRGLKVKNTNMGHRINMLKKPRTGFCWGCHKNNKVCTYEMVEVSESPCEGEIITAYPYCQKCAYPVYRGQREDDEREAYEYDNEHKIKTIAEMQRTSEEEFIAKALRTFVLHRGISVSFIAEQSQGMTGMVRGFEITIGDTLSSVYDREVEYFIPESGGVVKVLGESGGNESDPSGDIMTKMIDTRDHLTLNLLTIIRDLS